MECQCSPESRIRREKPAKDITELWEELQKLVWECAGVCSSWHNQMSSLTKDGFCLVYCMCLHSKLMKVLDMMFSFNFYFT